MSPTLHVLSLPHTCLTEAYSSCAYSGKVVRFVPMMQEQGFRVILYGPDVIECEPDEHVVITTASDRERWGFGERFNTALSEFLWDWGQPYWYEANTRMTDALRERLPEDRRGHFLCLVTSTQKPVADAVAGARWNNPLTVEWAVGYEGITGPFCAFESASWRSHVYGIKSWRNGRAFDAVIPNFFDAIQFPLAVRPARDYLLYIGRVVKRKGPDIALLVAERAGLPLKVAGPGPTEWRKGKIVAPEVTLVGDVEYMGEVGFAERAELMGNALAVIAPTVYIEPFGGAAVEAMLCGTPAVASDWGAFVETIEPGLTGERFSTLRQGAVAVEKVRHLKAKKIRQRALERFSMEAVGPRFRAWFEDLDSLWESGYYQA